MIFKILLFFIFCSSAFAKLFFEVSIENRKGIDLGLVLTSELHVFQEVYPRESFELEMKNGVKVNLVSDWGASNIIGPSDRLLINGKIINKNGDTLKDFSDAPLMTSIGEKVSVVFEKDSQRIEIDITPQIK